MIVTHLYQKSRCKRLASCIDRARNLAQYFLRAWVCLVATSSNPFLAADGVSFWHNSRWFFCQFDPSKTPSLHPLPSYSQDQLCDANFDPGWTLLWTAPVTFHPPLPPKVLPSDHSSTFSTSNSESLLAPSFVLRCMSSLAFTSILDHSVLNSIAVMTSQAPALCKACRFVLP